MSEYIVSARKYRPVTFDTVVGQKALTTTLRNAVHGGKLAHAYLFCGPRGVGKTTCARIFARAINCERPTPDGEACGECESCRAFNEQRSLNIFELDAASNNSVEHIKTLMEQTRIPPQTGRYKVFIIDEVHMLSTAAFNAFLKTLEEPPAHVIFILATTEKHKILPTILSRCQIYDFERMTVDDTVAHLRSVASREGITAEEEALRVIAEKADGGMRDALSIFDQAASFCQGHITLERVTEDLGVLPTDNYFHIVDLSLQNKVADIMATLNGILARGFEPQQVVAGLARHIRNVLMARDEQTLPLIEAAEQTRQRYKEQAARCPAQYPYQALQALNRCDLGYRQSSNKRLLVELTLIEVAQITQPGDNGADGAGRKPRRLKSLFRQLTQPSQPSTAAQQVAAAASVGVRNAPQRPSTPTTAQPAAAPAQGLKLKSSIGYSWKNLREAAKPKKMNVIPGTLDASDPNAKAAKDEHELFTQQDLELQWMSMCNRMPQKLSGVAARMKNMRPVITEMPTVEVAVDNQLVCDQLMQISGSVVNTLKLYLHNSAITLNIRVAEQQAQARILTRREQFELMSQANPAIETLREVFGLELA